MKFTGHLKANFIAINDKSHASKAGAIYKYKITGLRNIVITNAIPVNDDMFAAHLNDSVSFTDEKKNVLKIESISVPFNGDVVNCKGIDPLRFKKSTIKLSDTHKVNRGYFIKYLKGARFIDASVAIAINIFILPFSLLFPSYIGPLTDSVYLGRIEADFVGQDDSIELSVSSNVSDNLSQQSGANGQSNNEFGDILDDINIENAGLI
jgi:hypothetical protein